MLTDFIYPLSNLITARSSMHADSSGRKIALLVDVVVGNVIELTPSENLQRGGLNYDAVRRTNFLASPPAH